jgi:hypothetical protein
MGNELRPHEYGSFSYKVTDKRVQRILQARSKLSNVVQVAMPFVKVTSTIEIPEYLGGENIGFTLGIHSAGDDLYKDIFGLQGTEDPYLGYTYTPEGKNEPIFARLLQGNDLLERYLSSGRFQLVDGVRHGSAKVPPPGVTNLKIGRNRAGLSMYAEVTISVPTLRQLEYLSRVFLIPGCGMVVEWGQQFAENPNYDEALGESGLRNRLRENMFPWYDRPKLTTLLTRLGNREVGIQEIYNDYVYETQGQYMWMFGRIGNISTKGNSDGSFDVTVKITGPAEDQWAYSVKQTVLPASSQNSNKPCVDDANSVENYMTKTTVGGYNLKTLLDGVMAGSILPEWRQHVVQVENGNKKEGTEGQSSAPNANQTSFADVDNAYFMSWRFFVNIVLNGGSQGATGGIRGLFERAKLDENVQKRIQFIRPYEAPQESNVASAFPLDDPFENYVGANPYLRSYDPGTLIIVNEFAANSAQEDYATPEGSGAGEQLVTLTAENDITRKFLAPGNNSFDFLRSVSGSAQITPEDVDKGLLSTGVWINHKAVISSMLGGSTVLQGISNLLNRMNNATKNYWSLTLDPAESLREGEPSNYLVVDATYRGSSEQAVSQLNREIYTFNKYLRKLKNGTNVGSELTDFSVDLDLPKLLYSQIATTGINQESDKADAAADSSGVTVCKNGTISDPNDTLRKVFGMITVSPTRTSGFSIDVTNRGIKSGTLATCTAPSVSSTPAGTSGQGNQTAPPTPEQTAATQAEVTALKDQRSALQTQYVQLYCDTCDQCDGSLNTIINGPVATGVPAPLAQAGPRAGIPMGPSPSNAPTTHTRNGDTVTLPRERTLLWGSVKGALNAAIPLERMTNIIPFGNSKVAVAANGFTDSKAFLENEAARWFGRLAAYATNAKDPLPVQMTISSAYRPLNHQHKLKLESTSGGVAPVGSSPHGMGIAIDISELYGTANRAAGGITSKEANATCRQTPLYKWMERNAPYFGFVNPRTLKDNVRVDECWHWEYWGYQGLQGGTGVPTGVPGQLPGQTAPPSRYSPESCKEAKVAVAQKVLPEGRGLGRRDPAEIESEARYLSRLELAGEQACFVQVEEGQTQNRYTRCHALANQIAGLTAQINEKEGLTADSTLVIESTREFPNMNQVLRYVEATPDYMVARIRCTANGNRANAFGAAPGTLSIKSELTLPGIAGLRVGELFWIDKIPAYYKIFGAFQVMSIEDVIGMDGWKTKISASFNFLGNEWKNKMLKDLQEPIAEILDEGGD